MDFQSFESFFHDQKGKKRLDLERNAGCIYSQKKFFKENQMKLVKVFQITKKFVLNGCVLWGIDDIRLPESSHDSKYTCPNMST